MWSANARKLLRYGLPDDPLSDGLLTMNLLLALSHNADTLRSTAEKPKSNPGVMMTIGGTPIVIVRSATLDPFARLRVVALVENRGYALLGAEWRRDSWRRA